MSVAVPNARARSRPGTSGERTLWIFGQGSDALGNVVRVRGAKQYAASPATSSRAPIRPQHGLAGCHGFEHVRGANAVARASTHARAPRECAEHLRDQPAERHKGARSSGAPKPRFDRRAPGCAASTGRMYRPELQRRVSQGPCDTELGCSTQMRRTLGTSSGAGSQWLSLDVNSELPLGREVTHLPHQVCGHQSETKPRPATCVSWHKHFQVGWSERAGCPEPVVVVRRKHRAGGDIPIVLEFFVDASAVLGHDTCPNRRSRKAVARSVRHCAFGGAFAAKARGGHRARTVAACRTCYCRRMSRSR
jgi:hypothetical protein